MDTKTTFHSVSIRLDHGTRLFTIATKVIISHSLKGEGNAAEFYGRELDVLQGRA